MGGFARNIHGKLNQSGPYGLKGGGIISRIWWKIIRFSENTTPHTIRHTRVLVCPVGGAKEKLPVGRLDTRSIS